MHWLEAQLEHLWDRQSTSFLFTFKTTDKAHQKGRDVQKGSFPAPWACGCILFFCWRNSRCARASTPHCTPLIKLNDSSCFLLFFFSSPGSNHFNAAVEHWGNQGARLCSEKPHRKDQLAAWEPPTHGQTREGAKYSRQQIASIFKINKWAQSTGYLCVCQSQ